MVMTNMPINEKNMVVLNSILSDGFSFIDDNVQPKNINQVITFLLDIADGEGYLKSEASEIFDKIKTEERERNFDNRY